MPKHTTKAQHVALTLLGGVEDADGDYEFETGDSAWWVIRGRSGAWYSSDVSEDFDDPVLCAIDGIERVGSG